MIPLLFVGDGKLDEVTIPRIVETLIEVSVKETTVKWPHLHGKGYDGKIPFLVVQAQDRNAVGIVAVADEDKSSPGERLKKLRLGREFTRRSRPPFPIALGCCRPHLEAWLLDDPVAVRAGLRLSSEIEVPNVRKVNSPKSSLETLLKESPRSDDDKDATWADIARALVPQRCVNASTTGFESFTEEVRSEIQPLVRE